MAVLPLLLCLALSYGLSLYHFRDEARSLAEANARRVADILHSGDVVLAMLAKSTAGECNPGTVEMMNHAVFHGMYFREAGIERDGNLVCTSLEMLAPGFSITNARRKPAARIGDMEILSPTKTIRGGESLILNRPLRADRRHFINLLLDPQVLVETSRYYEGFEASTFLDDVPNGKQGTLDLLVATTVIEVGVDVPNASLMVVENAERMGLAQLHQLRGRVGRGSVESTCVLLYQGPLSPIARERLAVLRETNDGFEVARRDLELRGPGELLGTRQTGLMQLRVADLIRDADLLPDVQRASALMLGGPQANIAGLVGRWVGAGERFRNV